DVVWNAAPAFGVSGMRIDCDMDGYDNRIRWSLTDAQREPLDAILRGAQMSALRKLGGDLAEALSFDFLGDNEAALNPGKTAMELGEAMAAVGPEMAQLMMDMSDFQGDEAALWAAWQDGTLQELAETAFETSMQGLIDLLQPLAREFFKPEALACIRLMYEAEMLGDFMLDAPVSETEKTEMLMKYMEAMMEVFADEPDIEQLLEDGEWETLATLFRDAIYALKGILVEHGLMKWDGEEVTDFAPVTKSATGIEVAAAPPETGQTVEYAISETDEAPADGWQDSGVFADLTSDTLYYLFARAKENATHHVGPAASLAVKTNLYDGETVTGLAPVSKSTIGITVTAVAPENGQTVEYAISETNEAPANGWQDSGVFTGLTADTQYYLFARAKENATHYAGNAIALAVETRKRGDADENGNVNAADAAAILRHLVQLKLLTPEGLINAKVTAGTNPVSAADAAKILRFLVQLELNL
ncbi:MAG: dockerin type I repeat-containing protein, partial [Clostridiales bacterium]|nr:dockerin type I repeat-containing protein [Clostridiales bacterium]